MNLWAVLSDLARPLFQPKKKKKLPPPPRKWVGRIIASATTRRTTNPTGQLQLCQDFLVFLFVCLFACFSLGWLWRALSSHLGCFWGYSSGRLPAGASVSSGMVGLVDQAAPLFFFFSIGLPSNKGINESASSSSSSSSSSLCFH